MSTLSPGANQEKYTISSNLPSNQFMIEDIEQSKVTIEDLLRTPSEGTNILDMDDESAWYPHKYPSFDPTCVTYEQVCEGIMDVIERGISTPDLEAQKYLFFQKTLPFVFVLDQYGDQIKDWVQLFATFIINCCHEKFFLLALNSYHQRFNCLPSCDPDDNELLWLCLKVGNVRSFVLLCTHCIWNVEQWKDVIAECTTQEMLAVFEPCEERMLDPENPRNLVYALFQNNIEFAIQLIQAGCTVDIWNNFPMKMIMSRTNFKTNKQLVKLMFDHGAKIPSYYIATKRHMDRVYQIKQKQAEIAARDLSVKVVQRIEEMAQHERANPIPSIPSTFSDVTSSSWFD